MIDIDHLYLQSPNIVIRRINEADLEDLYRAYSNPAVMQFTSDPPFASRAMMLQFYSSVEHGYATREYFELAIVYREKDVVGTCSIHSIDRVDHSAEVGYLLAEEYWRHGIMTEALAMLIQYCAEEHGLLTLYADVDRDNVASRALLRKLGFGPVEGKEHLLRKTLPVKGRKDNGAMIDFQYTENHPFQKEE